jgi:hypothetical protein
MNDELIKEFARQSGFKVNWQHQDVQAIKMAQYREFAELIVKECLSVVYDPDGTDYGSIHDIVYADIESRIKEHFGVEE